MWWIVCIIRYRKVWVISIFCIWHCKRFITKESFRFMFLPCRKLIRIKPSCILWCIQKIDKPSCIWHCKRFITNESFRFMLRLDIYEYSITYSVNGCQDKGTVQMIFVWVRLFTCPDIFQLFFLVVVWVTPSVPIYGTEGFKRAP